MDIFTVYNDANSNRKPNLHNLFKNENEIRALTWEGLFIDTSPNVPFYETVIGPLMNCLRILGRAPFYRDKRGHIEYKMFSVIMVYSILVTIVTGTSSLLSVYAIMNSRKESFNSLSDSVLTSSTIIPQLLLPFTSWIECSKHQKYLQKWMQFEEMFSGTTGYYYSPAYARKHICNYLLSIALQSIILLFVIPLEMENNLKWYHFPGYIFSMFGHIIFFTYWYATSTVVTKVSSKFREHFEKEISKGGGYTDKIEKYRLLWMSLSELVQTSGSSNGFTISLYLFTNIFYFVMMTYNTAFDFADNIVSRNYTQIVAGIISSIFWLWMLIYFCNAGYKMAQECNEGILLLVLKLKQNVNWKLADEPRMNIFLYTLGEYKPTTSISGYFNLDRALFGSIITSLITYMIVLIQFHIATPNAKSDNELQV